MYDDPIYARVINLLLIFFLLMFRTNARHGVWGALRLSHNTYIVQLPLVEREQSNECRCENLKWIREMLHLLELFVGQLQR
jgi:hypothetical protein